MVRRELRASRAHSARNPLLFPIFSLTSGTGPTLPGLRGPTCTHIRRVPRAVPSYPHTDIVQIVQTAPQA